jgi:hypothetical protein
MADERPTRWQKARQDWPGFRLWPDIWLAVFGGALSVGVLAILGFPWEAILEVIVAVGAGAVAVVLFRFGELWWAWAQAPMRLLTDDVAALRREVAALPQRTQQPAQSSVAAQKARSDNIKARMGILRQFEEELRGMKRGAEQALERGSTYPYTKSVAVWDQLGTAVGSLADWRDLYATLRDAYDVVRDTHVESWVGIAAELPAEKKEKLERIVHAVTKGLDAVQAEIERTATL